jgi:RHS repeat-associated protein
VLLDFAGAVAQLYAFDAYGNAIGFNPAEALTEFLYSGEQFDSKIGQQYLRQRYYDPSTGRFNRLDPFFGNLSDPQTFHKYLYTHANPVNGIDPSGNMTVGMAISIGIQVGMRAAQFGAIGAATGAVFGGIFGGLDAWAGGNDVWTGITQGAKHGALFGLAFGAYLGAGPLLLSGGALMAIKIALVGYAGVTTTTHGVITADNSLQAGIRLTAGALMIWRILSMPTVPVKIELFGGKTGQIKDHINMDIIAEKGIQTDLTQPIPLPANVSEIVANNPYLSSGNIMNWLPNAAEVLKPGGRLIINGTKNNKYANPTASQAEQCGLRIVEVKENLAPEYQDLTFHFTDGTIIPQTSVRTIILEKK